MIKRQHLDKRIIGRTGLANCFDAFQRKTHAGSLPRAEYLVRRCSRRQCQFGVTSDVLSTFRALPLCPQFQTYCCLAANDVLGQGTKSLRSSPLRGAMH